jgi:hypothetical protein
MAATNNSGNNQDGKRHFQIGRENGSKTGKAVILEWLPELPAETAGRKFETRTSESGSVRHYEVFTAIDGILIDLQLKNRIILNEEKTFLIATLDDGFEVQEIQIGDADGRYSMDLLKTLLNPSIDFKKKLRFSPYAYVKDDKQRMGISVYNGVDQIKWFETGLYKIADPEQTTHKGKTLWNFLPVFESLWKHATEKVMPIIQKNTNVLPQADQKQSAPAATTHEDLPF